VFELFFLASIISAPIGLTLVAKNKKVPELVSLLKNKKKLFYIALAAILLYVPYEYGIAYAEHFISASLATVLFRLNPLLMLIFLPFFLRERLSKRQLLALGLAFAGILIGIGGGNPSNIFGSSDIMVVTFVVLLALGYAFANVVIKWQMFENDIFLSASAIILTIFFALLFFGSGARFAPLTPTDIGIIIWLAVTNIFSFGMYMYSLKVLKTTIVTNTFLLSPFFTFVWAFALFGQVVQPYYIAIGVLVSIGIVIQRSDRFGGSYAPKKARVMHNFTIFDMTGAFVETKDTNISGIIKSGGRVLATKLDRMHRSHIISIIQDGRFTNIFTGEEEFISKEAKFVKDILGISGKEVMVLKAGTSEDNESFFDELHNRLSASQENGALTK
jgi:drug/metabolite transporter (DMT)-like permease